MLTTVSMQGSQVQCLLGAERNAGKPSAGGEHFRAGSHNPREMWTGVVAVQAAEECEDMVLVESVRFADVNVLKENDVCVEQLDGVDGNFQKCMI